jgi:hypothetical protein
MSSSLTERLAGLGTQVERRFYERTAPSRELPVAFGPDNAGTLVNLSENGLQVSTPARLDLNAVFYLTLPLNGILKPIRVLGRTIWTSQSRQLAGIQLHDLSDGNRQQLRQWSALQASRSQGQQPGLVSAPGIAPQPKSIAPSLVTVAPSPHSSQFPVFEYPPPAAAENRELVPVSTARESRFNPQSSRPVLVFWSAALATILLAVGWAVADNAWERSHTATTSAAKTSPARPRRTSPVSASGVSNDSALPAVLPAKPNTSKKPTSPNTKEQNADPHSSRGNPAPVTEPAVSESGAAHPAPQETTLPAASAIHKTIARASSMANDVEKPSAAPTEKRTANSAAIPNVDSFPSAISGESRPPQQSSQQSSLNSSGTRQSNLSANSNLAPPVFPPASAPDTPSVVRKTTPPAPAWSAHSVNSQPRTLELAPPASASFIQLPGERVLRSPSVTMHIQRAVWIRGDHWFWHRHKKVHLGELSSLANAQIPSSPSRTGSITVQATVDKDGHITSIRPLYGTFAFLPEVSRALRSWQYQRTYVDHQPVVTQAKIEVNFQRFSAQDAKR